MHANCDFRLILALLLFVSSAFSFPCTAQTQTVATPSISTQLQGRIEITSLGKSGIADTQSHYWSDKGAGSYAQGDMDKAQEAFQKALDAADESKLSFDQKAILVSNLAAVKREKHEFDQAEQLFKKALELQRLAPKPDAGLRSYIAKQYAWIYRLQGKDSAADAIMENSNTDPSVQKFTPLQGTGLQGIKDLSKQYAGLEISSKLAPLPRDQLKGQAFVDNYSKHNGEYKIWHKVPRGLSGSWHCSDTGISTRIENLVNGLIDDNLNSNTRILHGLAESHGRQVDANGDVWDFDEYPFSEWIADPLPGTKMYEAVTFLSTVSGDQNSMSTLSRLDITTISTADNTILQHQRFESLEREYVVDKNSFGYTSVTVCYDDQGRAIRRNDFIGSGYRVAEFQKDDQYRTSFINFLKAKGLSNLIPN